MEGDPQAQLRKLAKDLKDAGEKDLRKALYRNLTLAARPLLEDAKREGGATTPHSGGAADRLLAAKFSARALLGMRNPGVKLRAIDSSGKSIDLRSLDRGRLRHPLFGNREHWYNTAVTPGWWSRPMNAGKAQAERAVKLAIDEMVVKFYTKRP